MLKNKKIRVNREIKIKRYENGSSVSYTINKFEAVARPPVGASEHSASECMRRTAHLGWSGRRPWRTRNVQHALGCRKTAFRRRRRRRPARTHARPSARPHHRRQRRSRTRRRGGGGGIGGRGGGNITKTSDARPAPKTAENRSAQVGGAAATGGRGPPTAAPPSRARRSFFVSRPAPPPVRPGAFPIFPEPSPGLIPSPRA